VASINEPDLRGDKDCQRRRANPAGCVRTCLQSANRQRLRDGELRDRTTDRRLRRVVGRVRTSPCWRTGLKVPSRYL